MSYRKFELSTFDGVQAPFKTAKERRALIGKRIGYDTAWSAFSQFGRVTDAYGSEIEVDGSPVSVGGIQQLCILNDQGDQGAVA